MNLLQSFDRFLLVGHPNVGKSFFFNTLTHLSAQTGNRPGVTIERQEGRIFAMPNKFLEDLPGIYYLEKHYQACAIDQQVTLTRLENIARNELLVNVIDSRSLRPQLHLTLQLIELRRPLIILLTFTTDRSLVESLQASLGVATLLEQDFSQEAVWKSIQATCGSIAHIPSHPEIDLFFQTLETARPPVQEGLKELALSDPTWDFLHNHCQTSDRASTLATLRYQFIDRFLENNDVHTKPSSHFNELLDRIVLHRIFGLPLFLIVMYSVFWITIVGGGYIEDGLGVMLDAIPDFSIATDHIVLHSAIAGLKLGVLTVLSFIGPLAILYTCLSILEQSGYMQRAALVIDRFMQYLKLPGQSFVPIVVGLGCNVPAILSARTLSDPTDRLQTILMSPFMSCSARLAIFTVFAQAFFGSQAYYAIFGLYLLGFAIAVFTGLAVRFVFHGAESSPLIMQYVDYQRPNFLMIFQTTYMRLQDFIIKAVQWIIPAIFIIHLMIASQWTVPMGIFKPIMKIFEPMGLSQENWPAVLSLFSGLIAKEVLIGTLQGAYQTGSAPAMELNSYFNNAYAAMSYLIFVLLYFPCVSVTFAIARETHMFWAVFSAIWSTSLAYCCAVLYYQWFASDLSYFALVGLTSLCLIYLLFIIMIVKYQMKTDTKRSIPFRLKVSTSY